MIGHLGVCRRQMCGEKDIHMFVCVNVYIYIYGYIYLQPIPRGVTFSKALSKLKAQSSNVYFH